MFKNTVSKITLSLFIAGLLCSCISFRGFKPNPPEIDSWAPYTGFNEQEEICHKEADNLKSDYKKSSTTDHQMMFIGWGLREKCLIENGYLLRTEYDTKPSFRRNYICEHRKELPGCNTPFWQNFFKGKTRSERPFIDSVVNPIEKSKEREYERSTLQL